MSLSDKINYYDQFAGSYLVVDALAIEDVREAVKELKSKLLNPDSQFGWSLNEASKIIDEIFGSKLI